MPLGVCISITPVGKSGRAFRLTVWSGHSFAGRVIIGERGREEVKIHARFSEWVVQMTRCFARERVMSQAKFRGESVYKVSLDEFYFSFFLLA